MFLLSISCHGQLDSQGQKEELSTSAKLVGGGCDGCELMFVGMPDTIEAIEYSPAWKEEGQKLLVTGTIYEIDGETPTPNVILYDWQTDNQGLYTTKNTRISVGSAYSFKRYF